ncbi:DUF3762 domain-containing protein [Leptospira kmetyi]|uniref:DUF3762 domain-containing protein n=1 Tax=Leptospira kmetyi TaxID=408139 RepID=A0AAD0XQX1_9LEPT|nr:DUF3762 domain-containing protein [Leptospira kmetyi]TGL68429.1 DUF3762 domain-containing protein [Leptospira kmetyi]
MFPSRFSNTIAFGTDSTINWNVSSECFIVRRIRSKYHAEKNVSNRKIKNLNIRICYNRIALAEAPRKRTARKNTSLKTEWKKIIN